ncbi:MAG: EAL domain-containing protein [Leucobacter sp.]
MRIVFQPIIDLTAWSVVGVEALARFKDGVAPPVHLAEAERVGSRLQLELELIRLALSTSKQLPENLLLTMNASGTTMLHDDLEALLAGLERRWGLELYEGATPANLKAIRDRISLLGGDLLIDDAGAASANSARIRELRPDVVKIDRELFWQLRTDKPARERIGALVAAAHATGAQLLIEGVEDAAHVDLARELGAELAQGFYLGMPTPAENMHEMLQELHRGLGMNIPGL